MASAYDEVRKAFIAERPTYKELCARSAELLDGGLREAGIRAGIDSRVKDVVSFLRKVLREPEYLSGEKAVEDKAGVRVVLPYFDDEPTVREIIDSRFEVFEREETVNRLGADRLGYLGVHYIARPKAEHLSEEQATLFEGLKIEIQVGSMAQRAWAEVSHELLYKASLELPVAYRRIVNRLIALVELFDSEVGRVRERIAALPGFEMVPLLDSLDRELLRFSGRQPDRVLSQELMPALAALYPESSSEIYPQRLQGWIEGKREALAELYGRYEDADTDVNPLFFQPEAMLIFERLENDPTGVEGAWPPTLPRELLVSLSELWGFPLS